MKNYWVYILASRNRKLYIGMTNNLKRRVREHKAGIGSQHTTKYKVNQLAHYERFKDPNEAIRREKELKGWTRERKMQFIESTNQGWVDLAAELDKQIAIRAPA